MIAFIPALLSGVASVLIGWLWYSPHLFGAVWVRSMNLAPEQIERGRRFLTRSEFLGLLACMVIAYAMGYIGTQLQITTPLSALGLGCVCWLGFCAPTLLGQVLWEQKPLMLFLINALYWLLSFVATAFILFYTAAL